VGLLGGDRRSLRPRCVDPAACHALRRARNPRTPGPLISARAIRYPGFTWPIVRSYCKLTFSEAAVARFKVMLKYLLRRRALHASAVFVRGFLPLFLFALTFAGVVAGADAPKSSTISVGPGLQFAVADFDGDHRPDLVGVQAGQGDLARTKYWIQLQLSAAGRQSISLVAPSGGLQIAARDVNGDQIPDLILTTAWLRQPVAIFINDGHGAFTRAEPAAYPEAFRESQTNWNSFANQVADAVGVPPPSQDGACIAIARSRHTTSQASDISPLHRGFFPGPFLISQRGRAPPSEVPYL
jgi:hypothetical protein